MSIKYEKSPVPVWQEDIPSYLQTELDLISSTINNIADGHMDVSNIEPVKPRAGDIRYADGSNWNPGSTGEGLYIYLSTGAWSKL